MCVYIYIYIWPAACSTAVAACSSNGFQTSIETSNGNNPPTERYKPNTKIKGKATRNAHWLSEGISLNWLTSIRRPARRPRSSWAA